MRLVQLLNATRCKGATAPTPEPGKDFLGICTLDPAHVKTHGRFYLHRNHPDDWVDRNRSSPSRDLAGRASCRGDRGGQSADTEAAGRSRCDVGRLTDDERSTDKADYAHRPQGGGGGRTCIDPQRRGACSGPGPGRHAQANGQPRAGATTRRCWQDRATAGAGPTAGQKAPRRRADALIRGSSTVSGEPRSGPRRHPRFCGRRQGRPFIGPIRAGETRLLPERTHTHVDRASSPRPRPQLPIRRRHCSDPLRGSVNSPSSQEWRRAHGGPSLTCPARATP